MVFGTYVGIGALAHDLGFSLPWALGTTLFVWAAPNQVILISALGAGMAPLAAALAVSLSGVRSRRYWGALATNSFVPMHAAASRGSTVTPSRRCNHPDAASRNAALPIEGG